MRPRRLLIPVAALAVIAGLSAAPMAASAATSASHAAAAKLPSLKGTDKPAIRLKTQQGLKGPSGIPLENSGNWTGFIDEPKTGGAPTFKKITSSYTVPSVNCARTGSSINAFAYHWIGLDGWNSGTVEQDGVADFCESGVASYDAWHEMYPAGFSLAFAVNAGDAISSSVTFNSGTGVYTLALKDVTSGQSFSVTAKCATAGTCKNNTAEVITEGYQSLPTWTGTADFGLEFYNAATVTDSLGHSGGLDSTSLWTPIQSQAIGPDSGLVMTNAGQLYNGISTARSAFQVTWDRVD